MLKYTFKPKPEKSVKVYGRALRISKKDSVTICKEITGKNLEKGKDFLDGLTSQKRDINGKYYTNSAKELLNLLKSAESNAEFKGLDTEKLFIHASAHKGFTFWRPRRFKLRRRKRKMANVQIVLEQR